MSGSLRVASFALLLVLVAFAGASAVTFYIVRDTVVAGLTDSLRQETERNLTSVQQTIDQLLIDVRIWAGGHIVSDLMAKKDPLEISGAQQEFALLGRSRNTIAELIAFEPSGRVNLAARDATRVGTAVPAEMLQRILAGDIYRSPLGSATVAGRPGLVYAVPLRTTDGSRTIIGGLAVVVGWQEVQRLFGALQITGLPQSGERRYLLTDSESRILFDSLAPNSLAPRWSRLDLDRVSKQSVVSQARSRWFGEFGDPTWTLTALVDRTQAFASVEQMGRMMILSSAAVLLIAGLIGIVMFRRFMSSSAAREEQRIRALADAPVEGIVICDGTTIVDANNAFQEMVGADRRALRDQSLTAFVTAADRRVVQEVLLKDAQATILVGLVARSGAVCPVELIRRARGDAPGSGEQTIVAIRDLSERTEAQSRIAFLAHHDTLTELPNRGKLASELEAALAEAQSGSGGLVLYYVDLDHFKSVNDRLGHAGGDAFLRTTAERLSGFVGEDGFAARLGGDEFVVVQSGFDRHADPSREANRLCQLLSRPLDIDGRPIEPSASIGVAVFPTDSQTADGLLRCADLALYNAKRLGRGRFHRFEPTLARAHDERIVLQNELVHAIGTQQLWLAYQPQTRCDDGRVVGFEVLARWTHPTLGEISPGAFIPVAEESGQIVRIGDWLLETACREAASWALPLDVAVNISAVQITQDDLPARLHEILVSTGLEAHRLELEITESVLIHDINRALHVLRRLKALGVRIAMDDFGTGYSSLRYLQSFPFDRLKIDRSFIGGLTDGEHGRTIVRAAVSLGRGLGLQVLAEGVETEEQWDLLRAEHCDVVQGYLLGRPERIEAWRRLTEAPAYLGASPQGAAAALSA